MNCFRQNKNSQPNYDSYSYSNQNELGIPADTLVNGYRYLKDPHALPASQLAEMRNEESAESSSLEKETKEVSSADSLKASEFADLFQETYDLFHQYSDEMNKTRKLSTIAHAFQNVVHVFTGAHIDSSAFDILRLLKMQSRDSIAQFCKPGVKVNYIDFQKLLSEIKDKY
jgi:hypothetical protein